MSKMFEAAAVIFSYTRAQAIEEGALFDVSDTAHEAGIKFPVAITRALHEKYVAVPEGARCQDEFGRLWDIVFMLRCAILAGDSGELVRFAVHVRNDNRRGTPPLRKLKAVCGPGDEGEPVITVMLPDED